VLQRGLWLEYANDFIRVIRNLDDLVVAPLGVALALE
jgi:hypothetical protein